MADGATQPVRQPSPDSWWKVRHLLAAGVLLSLTVLALAALFLLFEYDEIKSKEIDRAELIARLLTRQAEGVLSSDDSGLDALAQDLVALASAHESSALSAALARAFGNRPELRSVTLVDHQGKVLGSSSPDNISQVLPPSMVARLRGSTARPVLGPLMSGRDLADLAPPEAKRTTLPVLPVLRAIGKVDKNPVYLVHLFNLEHFASQFEAMLMRSDTRAALAAFDGTLLNGTTSLSAEPGQSLRNIEAFSAYLPTRESGHYIGAGIAGDKVLTAFAPLRRWPLLVIVEVPYRLVASTMAQAALLAFAVVLLLLGATAGVLIPAARSLRRHQDLLDNMNEVNQALRDSDQRNEAVLRSALDGIVTIDRHGNIVAFNPAAEHIFGHRQDAALGRPMAELIVPPSMRAAHHAGFELHQRSGVAKILNQRLEVPALHADGHEFPIELTVVKHDIDGEPSFTATVRDITEQRRIREEKAELLSTYRVMASDLEGQKFALDQHAIVSIANRSFHLTYANDKLVELSGYSRDELLGSHLHAHRVNTMADKDYEAMREALNGGRVWHGDWTSRRRDGSLYWVECTIVPLKGPDGRVREFISIQTDVTHRRQIEMALQVSEERFRTTFEQAGVGLLRLSLDRRVLMANTVLMRMFGYLDKEIEGKSIDTIRDPEDVGAGPLADPALIARLLTNEQSSIRIEKRFLCKDGTFKWVRVTVTIARDTGGQPQYLICVIEDIDDYRHAQTELAAARARELEIGTRIQQGLLVAQRPPEIGGLWVSTYSQASGGIDGDFVDVIRISEHVVDVLSGDVMGKGVPAALLGAATKLQFSRSLAELLNRREQGEGPPKPSAVVAAVNLEMAPHLLALEAFVTLVYLRIDTLANTLTWVGCGHEATLLVSAAGACSVLANQQPPIGIFLNAAYEQDRCTLAPGDGVFLCSDGVTEAIDVSGERMGSERVRQRAAHRIRRHGSPAMALHALRQDGARARVVDDVTMVMLMRSELHGQVHRIELALSLDSIQRLRDFVAQNTQPTDLSEERIANFTVAAVEVFTNIWRHGHGLLVGAPVEAFIEQRDTGVELELRHVGEPFVPPTEVPETDLAPLPEGGFGLYIIQSACDEVLYQHQEGVNTVRLTLGNRVTAQAG